MARRVELVGGGLAATIGLVVAGLTLGLGGAGWAVALFGLSGLAAGLGAYRHTRYGETNWLLLIWAGALGLIVSTILAVFSVGIFLLPGAVAAVVAAAAGSRPSSGRPASR